MLAVLHKFSTVRPHPEAFVDALEPLQPRLYSISSSPKARDGGLSLTVDAVRYLINKRKRTGVASTFLADSIEPGERLRVYVQKAHGFHLPEDPAKPVIMVGPGTGVAPFRAFLQERQHSGAPGQELAVLRPSATGDRLLLPRGVRGAARGRRADPVVPRLVARRRPKGLRAGPDARGRRADLWQWLEEGAHVYVCGDAKRMAKDVETTLVEIVTRHGHVGTDEAIGVVTKLKTDGRFQLDAVLTGLATATRPHPSPLRGATFPGSGKEIAASLVYSKQTVVSARSLSFPDPGKVAPRSAVTDGAGCFAPTPALR